MNTAPSLSLVLGWWNTSLSPRGETRNELLPVAHDVVSDLVLNQGTSCLGLGEVTASNLRELRNSLPNASRWGLLDGTGWDGKLLFDVGLLYDRTLLHVRSSKRLVSCHLNHRLRTAHYVELLHLATGSILHLFLIHWPSWRTHPQGGSMRRKLGHSLRNQIDSFLHGESRGAGIILMGDFNDEPFDRPLCEELLATRDRALLRKKVELLYNPFWRLMGESRPHGRTTAEEMSYAGTYFYKSGIGNRWHTFDQILLSASLIHSSDWTLAEEYVFVHHAAPISRLVPLTTSSVDHFPVIAVLQKPIQGSTKEAKDG